MKVNGFIVSADQIAAGCAVMKGEFTSSDVRRALLAANVPYSINDELPSHLQRVSDKYFVWEVANRLCQWERRAGRIENVHNRLWRTTV